MVIPRADILNAAARYGAIHPFAFTAAASSKPRNVRASTIPAPAERQITASRFLIRGHTLLLPFDPSRQRRLETRVCQPVIRDRSDRLETPHELVFTLGARIEYPNASFYAKFDTLVETNLEMKAVHRFHRAPVAAEQVGVIKEEQSATDDRFSPGGGDQQQMIPLGIE